MIRRVLTWSLVGAFAALAACGVDSRRLRDRAEAHWREGNYQEAIRLNTLVYERDRRGKYAPQALLDAGDIYYLNIRQLKNAIDAYKKVVEEFPEKQEAYKAREQLAVIYENEIRDLTQAIIQYDEILQSKHLDNRAEIQFKRANAYFKQEDYDRAWRELRRIEESGEGGPHLAGQVYLKLGDIDQIRHQYEDAAGYFQRVVNSPCPECRRQAILDLAETYEDLYDFDHAIETIRKLDHSPANDQLVSKEVARLTGMKRRLNQNATLNWANPPHARARVRKKK